MIIIQERDKLTVVPECLIDREKPCWFAPCCEAQETPCCHACEYKCRSKCKRKAKE
ncbi:MAG: hypothetical protein PUJ31_05045 [Prevotella pectinovora]|nr:hypothetical protein [Prevotella pectinovora]